ncbi:hypothetical protein [Pediococcus argentinicus]|nr:hypothetical protein [Pediococcus argentinicus]NKZ22739.1 DUF202 domain-containing protein [Pediococcus argentinicus]GEP19787.1 PTS sugar transporter [Pediococcus argentinicus]
MTIQEMKNGYEQEVAYQKKMLRNVGYWFQLGTVVSGIGIVLLYFFHKTNFALTMLGIVMFIIGSISMLIFGYVGWRGQKNINALIDDFDKKIKFIGGQTNQKKRHEMLKKVHS